MVVRVRTANVNRWHAAFVLLIFSLLIYLSVRAADDYRWSDWGFGDAQTMLSLRHWKKEGWLANKLLMIPQGYAKVVRIFDNQELRHHAHGTCPISSPRIGPRLWYTHYPSGYLIPYALLSRLGLDKIFFMRMLSIFFSLGAVIFMYALFSRILSPRVSFVAVFFYAASSAFLGYADSLANQPIDDFLRFGFMLGVVFYTQASSLKQRTIYMVVLWITAFLLSLSSFDSVFFIYFWLIGWDLLEYRQFRWKTYLIFALAPLAAHFVQFFQNVWYLGLNDAIIDIQDTLFRKSGLAHGYNFKPEGLLVCMFISYAIYSIFLKDRNEKELPSIGLLFLLFLCGLIYMVLLPVGALMAYEKRQMVPFVSILVSGMTWSFLKEFKLNVLQDRKITRKFPFQKGILLLYLLLSFVIIFAFWRGFAAMPRKPIYNLRGHPDVVLARVIQSIPTKYDPVIFNIGAFFEYWNRNYVPGYPQIDPITEYYVGLKPIISFSSSKGAITDLQYMLDHSPYKFSPLLVTADTGYIKEIILTLSKNGYLKQGPIAMLKTGDRYILDLTALIK